MVDAISREFASRENERLTEGEVDFFFENYSPLSSTGTRFRDFLKGLLKKGLNVVKGVASLALKGPLGLIFNLVKKHFRGIIGKIVQRGIQSYPQWYSRRPDNSRKSSASELPEPAPAPPPAAARAQPVRRLACAAGCKRGCVSASERVRSTTRGLCPDAERTRA